MEESSTISIVRFLETQIGDANSQDNSGCIKPEFEIF